MMYVFFVWGLALKKEKMEAQNMARAIQDLSIRHEEMKQIQESLQEQVVILRREVKAKREGETVLPGCNSMNFLFFDC